jgi:hypothetical protein
LLVPKIGRQKNEQNSLQQKSGPKIPAGGGTGRAKRINQRKHNVSSIPEQGGLTSRNFSFRRGGERERD